ncbi:MAG: S41 family peptidase [Caldiserica bacterium]|nr:S41 family peptidase [Caldisericota bacterium]
MKRKLALLVFSFALLIFLAGNSPSQEETIYPQLELFAKVIAIVQQSYVKEVSTKTLIEGALKGMIASLDPYSEFMTPQEYEDMKIETEGKFGGVGMVITSEKGIITVISPIEDTPAFRAGIKPRDKIIEIEGESTKGWSTQKAAHKLRGKPGTKVHFKIWREGDNGVKSFTITREIIKINSVKGPKIFDDKIAYIRLSVFRDRIDKELKNALSEVKEKHISALILDLRNNPGGLLDEAVKVSDLFLPRGKLVVYTQGRNKKNRNDYFSTNDPYFTSPYPIVILVNKGSASASEIVSAALKDWGVAILLGEKTFGKGSVQSILPVEDNYTLRLTTAHYYTPDNICIEGKGLAPDIEVSLKPEEEEKVLKAFIEGKKEGDIQLQKALEFLKQEMSKSDNVVAKDKVEN